MRTALVIIENADGELELAGTQEWPYTEGRDLANKLCSQPPAKAVRITLWASDRPAKSWVVNQAAKPEHKTTPKHPKRA